MALYDKVMELINERGLNVSKLEKGAGLANATIRKWTTQKASFENVQKIAAFLNVPLETFADINSLNATFAKDLITQDEVNLLNTYRNLSEERKAFILTALSYANEGQAVKSNLDGTSAEPLPFPTSEKAPMHDVLVYELPASAGNGAFLDSLYNELVQFPATDVPMQTSIGVRISGDSMAPRFQDGDVAFVKLQPQLEHGDIGIFVLNGEGFCKRYIEKDGKVYLESLNQMYPLIHINEDDEIRTVGKVMGRFTP